MDDLTNPRGNIIGAGVDAPRERRPGVPMETTPRNASGVHWQAPTRQQTTVEVLRRPDLKELTATFGTAQPPHGLSGILRRYAYTIPDHRPQHWAVLLLADRVDALETSAADLIRLRPVATAASALLLLGAAAATVALLKGGSHRRTRRRRLSWFKW
jgi:hypothetical protein